MGPKSKEIQSNCPQCDLPLDPSMKKNFQRKCLEVFKTVYLKMLLFYQLSKRILAYFQKSKTPSVIPFWKAILIYFKVARSIGHFSGHFKWLPWWSGSIYKKWLPWESIEARVLKFCVGLCMTNTHARKKERLNPRTKIYFDTLQFTCIMIFSRDSDLTTSVVRPWVS